MKITIELAKNQSTFEPVKSRGKGNKKMIIKKNYRNERICKREGILHDSIIDVCYW